MKTDIKHYEGDVDYKEIESYFNSKNEFKNEKHLCDFIENNIKLFCKDLEISYFSHERESYITNIKRFGANKPKVDFIIREHNNKVSLIEVKAPKNTYREINRCVSQILDYYIIAENNGLNINKAIIVTTKSNYSIIQLIKRFNLPIDLVLISKYKIAIWDKDR